MKKKRTSKIWQGRFKTGLNPVIEDFTESISFDYKLALYDIKGSIAHVKMLEKSGLINNTIKNKIIKGLSSIREQIENNKFKFNKQLEDIHINIEKTLEKEIGPTAYYLHTGRSRNDQVQLDTRLYIKDYIEQICKTIQNLQKVLISFCQKNIDIIIPGYTHLQHAQPVLLSHHLLAYVEMLERDKERLEDNLKRTDILPLGSGALSGSSLPLDRKYVAQLLNFKKVSNNSMDSVSDRDYIIEYLSCLSIIAVHLSRMSEDLILWNSPEYNFITLQDSVCTGSSLMPQKRNPDPLEIIRGKTGRSIGNLVNLLVNLKGLPMTYNRDLQEDKVPLFDSTENILKSISAACIIIRSITVNKIRVKQILKNNEFLFATDITEYLVKKGIPFRQAYNILGTIVKHCSDNNKRMSELSLKELKKYSNKFDNNFYNLLSAEVSIKNKSTTGSTNPSKVKKAITRWKKKNNA